MIGVIVGRFQVDEIHAGHLRLMQHVQDKHPQVLVLIGCRHSPANRRDPLSFPIRANMVRQVLPEATILPIYDMPEDAQWARTVDRTIEATFPGQTAMLYGGRDSFIPHYAPHGRFHTVQLAFPTTGPEPSSTERRVAIGERHRDSADFRAGVIWAMQTLHPRIYMCVDIAIVRTNPEHPNKEILVGKHANEKLWRLPGGHVDITDADLEVAARREFLEETGLSMEGKPRYLGSFTVEDWRDRGIPDAKHMTALYRCDYTFGQAQASDDLVDVRWLSLNANTVAHIIPDHRPLFLRVVEDDEDQDDVRHAVRDLQRETNLQQRAGGPRMRLCTCGHSAGTHFPAGQGGCSSHAITSGKPCDCQAFVLEYDSAAVQPSTQNAV